MTLPFATDRPYASERRPKVLLVCSGLDHARRGYESFARECFEALRDDNRISLELVKGSGRTARQEHVAWSLRRDRPLARHLGRLLKFRPFRLEALTFAAGLQPILAQRRPDLVYLSEWDTARGLALLRRATRVRFALLLCNGGFAEQGFGHLDHVQELVPAAREHVIRHGADPTRHTVLPLGFNLPASLERPAPEERAALRRRLGLPDDRPVLLSVAALNASHKRLDYLISEVGSLPPPRPFVLLVGEPDAETPAIRRLAGATLGASSYEIRTVPREEVDDLYLAASLFVLPSLHEMQGRAAVEAGAHGLPVLVHDSPVMRYALGSSGLYADLTESGSLSSLVRGVLAMSDASLRLRATELHSHVYDRFSWQRLRPAYVELFGRVADAYRTVSSSTAEYVPR